MLGRHQDRIVIHRYNSIVSPNIKRQEYRVRCGCMYIFMSYTSISISISEDSELTGDILINTLIIARGVNRKGSKFRRSQPYKYDCFRVIRPELLRYLVCVRHSDHIKLLPKSRTIQLHRANSINS